MEDNEATAAPNTTLVYDYSAYNCNYEPEPQEPCDLSGVTTFRGVFLPILYILVFIIGFIGNALVVYVLVMHRNSRSLIDTCLLNLAVSDLLFVLSLPVYTHALLVGEWTSGEFMCRFSATIHTTGFFSSVFTMVAMAMYRYFLVQCPRTMTRFRTVQGAILVPVLVWLLSLAVSLPAFVFSKVSNDSGIAQCHSSLENRGWRLYYLFATNILGIVLPLLVMVACYSMIIPRVIKMRSEKRHRTIKLVISIIVVFFLFWVPYNICLFLKLLKYDDVMQDDCPQNAKLWAALIVTETVAYTHCCLNPIIYAFVSEKFMKQALHLLRRVPGIHIFSTRDLSDFSSRKSSVTSLTLDVASTLAR